MIIDWDPAKDLTNRRKHGISFEFARSVFADPDRIDDFDDRDYDEERWRVFGRVGSPIVYVVYTERDAILRIISARKATSNEEAQYFRERLR